MGRTVSLQYVLDIYDTRFENGRPVRVRTELAWHGKRHGRANAANLERFVRTYAKSLEAGGVNEHLSKALGHIPYPNAAAIRYNRPNGAPVARWTAAPFQVW